MRSNDDSVLARPLAAAGVASGDPATASLGCSSRIWPGRLGGELRLFPGRGSPNCGTVGEERRPKAGKAFVRAEETVPRRSVTMRAMSVALLHLLGSIFCVKSIRVVLA